MGDRQAIIAGIQRDLKKWGSVSVPREEAPVKKPKKRPLGKRLRTWAGLGKPQLIPKVNPADRKFAEDWVKGKD